MGALQRLPGFHTGFALLFYAVTCLAAPSALSIAPSQYFEGNDGPWSTFNLRVGIDKQDVRVLISTAAPESLVVLADYGCSKSVFPDGVPSDCAVSRGNLVNVNQSTTWDELGMFGINDGKVGWEANLGYSQPSMFGLDTLGIGLVDGDQGVTLENQTLGGIATASPFYLGMFGINSQPLNFTSLGNFSSPSFLTSLKSQNRIPSLSWSYTAGAIYRLKKVYGQLIFSGYDTSRFAENAVTFTMADDVTRDLVVGLQAITYNGDKTLSLLSSPINIFIDSTDPNIWLPESAVKAFETAFGIELDETSGLYLVNDSHHSSLVDSNAEVAFRLADDLDGGETVSITLPYKAFGLKAEAPLVKNSSYYFPLKKADNESQYTLGRAFLQEAYLTVDYERRSFNVSQCSWVEGAAESILTILSRDNSTDNGSNNESPTDNSHSINSGSSLSGGAIAGIVIGAIAAVVLLAAAIFIFLRRRKQTHDSKTDSPTALAATLTSLGKSPSSTSGWDEWTNSQGEVKAVGELMGDAHHTYQLDGESTASTGRQTPVRGAAAVEVHELPGCVTPRGDTGVPTTPRLSEVDEMKNEFSMKPVTPESFATASGKPK